MTHAIYFFRKELCDILKLEQLTDFGILGTDIRAHILVPRAFSLPRPGGRGREKALGTRIPSYLRTLVPFFYLLQVEFILSYQIFRGFIFLFLRLEADL